MMLILMLARILIIVWLIREMFKFQKGIVQKFRYMKDHKLDTGENIIKLFIYDAVVVVMFLITVSFFVVV